MNLLLAAATAGHHRGQLLAALAPVLLVVVVVDAFCLTDLARAQTVRHLPKFAWALIILLISFPFGVLLYLFLGRDRGGRRVTG